MDLEDMNINKDIEVDDGASNKSIISEEREGVSKVNSEKLQEMSIKDILKAIPKYIDVLR
ncbi:hypothetical protein RhiirA5_412009 [Rhizophagus irregularis]|uniref:Uncharacterized protein n=1 Tax=Rhizophagus irregularis TaxID=588596 RepID=A0A2I1DTW3_9GLOM|nr:hypothetical protein RhiirA5_412009 [Rhizophagus irregularis]PKC73270.1 hypothetical protein RhiirA1_451382 [Rhizophagus irregularis]PKY13311.1 hypothetical protein RhiirB3_425125 [Rhizophagus irregularis]GET55200.1 hypothetical protein RIR_e75449_A0A2I1DTW3_9GLOM [Rhizophagus irregularis DAOM 181602=DAOM 197198]